MKFVTKHIKSISIIIFILAVILCAVYFQLSKPHSYTFYAFDTFVNLTLYGKNADAVADNAEKLIIKLENELSLYRSGSITDKINSADVGEAVEVSAEYAGILRTALNVSEKSGGAFDITIRPLSMLWDVKNRTSPPSDDEIAVAKKLVGYENLILTENTVTKQSDLKIDLGGIAKGYAADKLKELLVSSGIKKGIINMGGNVCTIGSKNKTEGWNIGICNPSDPSQVICSTKASDMSVVTSGGYQRYFEYSGRKYHHIISPHTGYPADSSLASVSVICESSMLGDALSTAAFVLGKEEGETLIKSFAAKGIIIFSDGEVYRFD